MSVTKKLGTVERNALGTGATRALRRTGHVPISVYGKNQSPINLSIEERFLVKEMKDKGFYSHLFKVNATGKDQTVLVRDVQLHPVSDRPLHLDLLVVDQDSAIKVDVAVRTLNAEKCQAIKQGGVLTLLRHDLPILCTPHNIPEFIDIDLSDLKIGSSVTLEDIVLPENVKIEHPEKIEAILTISQHRVSASQSSDDETSSEGTQENNTSDNK